MLKIKAFFHSSLSANFANQTNIVQSCANTNIKSMYQEPPTSSLKRIHHVFLFFFANIKLKKSENIENENIKRVR